MVVMSRKSKDGQIVGAAKAQSNACKGHSWV